MKHDNIASDDLPGLPELAVTPTAVEAIVHRSRQETRLIVFRDANGAASPKGRF